MVSSPSVLPKLFFFHNPKAGGTALIEAIRTKYGAHVCAPPIANTISEHAHLAGRYERFRGYDVYLGHNSREAFDAINDGHASITNFRHPVARIVSLYNYFKFVVPDQIRETQEAKTDFYCVDCAKRQNFDEFVANDHPWVRVYTSDHHFRQLTASQWAFEEPCASLEEAYAFIDHALCYYVCEYPVVSLRWFRLSLGIESFPRSNVTPGLQQAQKLADVSDTTYRAIMQMNQRDMALYRYAVNQLLSKDQSGCCAPGGSGDPVAPMQTATR